MIRMQTRLSKQLANWNSTSVSLLSQESKERLAFYQPVLRSMFYQQSLLGEADRALGDIKAVQHYSKTLHSNGEKHRNEIEQKYHDGGDSNLEQQIAESHQFVDIWRGIHALSTAKRASAEKA